MIFQCMYILHLVYPFIHQLVGCLQLLADVDNTALNTSICMCVFSYLLDIDPGMELLGSVIILCFDHCGTDGCFPKQTHCFTSWYLV